jgi:uncharacterized protein (TIGR03435 family)
MAPEQARVIPQARQSKHYKITMIPGPIEADSMPIGALADALSRVQVLGCTVVDKTGLTGNYHFSLRWTPDNPTRSLMGRAASGSAHADNAGDAAQLSLLTAIQEQLGLKLESEEDSIDVIVIDHIDPPSPN